MKVVAAVLLAALGGNSSPCADDIKGILGSVGIDCDDERIELLLGQLKGRDLAELQRLLPPKPKPRKKRKSKRKKSLMTTWASVYLIRVCQVHQN
ncbi:hypothetical protein SUGI_0918160 [Cryptomeria japonica]|nr:hypothetical protein SUGI_0918160 [Cryptomeria japonica]